MKIFKYNIKVSFWIALAMIIALGSCSKDDTITELGSAPTPDQVQFSITPTATNANVINFKNQSPGFKALWDFGNGMTAEGNDVQGSYPLAGTYTVKLTIVTAGGAVSNTKTVTIAATNPAMLTDPAFEMLSGGLANLNGKTWVIDQTQMGHLGVGPITSQGPDWYQAGPNEKNGLGFYDDEMTFNMNALKYTYANNGTTFANASNAPGIGGPTGSSDPTVNYTPPTNLTWLVTVVNGVKYLTISNNGFISYYLGVSQYQILSLTDDEMYLRSGDKANAGNAWYLKLIRKGYTRPVVQKPIQAANISDDFDASANITWTAENMTYKRAYDNPAPFSPNTSAKVGYYAKTAELYGNLQVTMPYRFDLTTKNKIRLKVYLPGGNDFTKVNPTVAVKLQNSLLAGNAWQTQTEKKVTISSSDYNKWVVLEFDFSDIIARTDYDKIVVQLGGEGHAETGIFYIDDFEFK